MTYCNSEAGDQQRSDDDRKQFMSSLLSG